MDFLPLEISGERVYVGFWKRFCAGWADFFILAPLSIVFVWLESFDKHIAIIIAIPSTALFAMYNVYFHARYGATIGKLAFGIRVTRPNGSPIGWTEAWKRSSVDLGFALIMLAARVWALIHVDGEQFSSSAFGDRMKLLKSHYPPWYTMVDYPQYIWIWSEVIVLLFNKRRRALHDFIAGTVVIHKEFAEKVSQADR